MATEDTASRARDEVTIRLSRAERALIERAAAARPAFVASWIRDAAVERARQEVGKAAETPSSAA
jgi:uncharacterized protein (DUF1778 family)